VRFYRTVFLEETNRDYVRTARAKGCGDGRVMSRHVLRNALIPILPGR
jgi:peptide/nickel transport system permease protein